MEEIMTDIDTLQRILAKKQFGKNIIISKKKMPRVPITCEETLLGDPDEAHKQYRCDHNIHILEYPDRYKLHKDMVDPRSDPLGHLIYDSPEALAALGVGGTLGIVTGKRIYDKRKSKSKSAILEAIIGGILTAVVSAPVTYYILKKI